MNKIKSFFAWITPKLPIIGEFLVKVGAKQFLADKLKALPKTKQGGQVLVKLNDAIRILDKYSGKMIYTGKKVQDVTAKAKKLKAELIKFEGIK